MHPILTSAEPVDSMDMAWSSAYSFLAFWRSLLSDNEDSSPMSTLDMEGRPSPTGWFKVQCSDRSMDV